MGEPVESRKGAQKHRWPKLEEKKGLAGLAHVTFGFLSLEGEKRKVSLRQPSSYLKLRPYIMLFLVFSSFFPSLV